LLIACNRQSQPKLYNNDYCILASIIPASQQDKKALLSSNPQPENFIRAVVNHNDTWRKICQK
jgi:hypothetical protein